MYKSILVFIVSFTIAFGSGYAIYSAKDSNGEQTQSATAETTKADAVKVETAATTGGDGQIFSKLGCISCHSVSALDAKGGQVGPDLSTAYLNVESKHSMKLEDFLKKPNSAVMSGVIGGKPLTDDELKTVVAALKTASEKSK